MRTIVRIKRHNDGRERVYEAPAGVELTEGTEVKVETAYGETSGTVVNAPIELDDDTIAYFIQAPLNKVTAIITANPVGWPEEE